MEIIQKYFPQLSADQIHKFGQLRDLYELWNSQINVISRKDMDSFYERHVLHSLAIAKVIEFPVGAKVMDVGTGGGFPGIPLAIMFPEVDFVLVDSIGKKIKVVTEVSSALGLKNVEAHHCRAESLNEKFDFVVSRAVTEMKEFYAWVKNMILFDKDLLNGIYYLKGGDLNQEMAPFKGRYKEHDIASFYEEEFFETKKVIFLRNTLVK